MTSNTHDRYRRKRLFEIGALEFSKGVENLMLEGRLDPIPIWSATCVGIGVRSMTTSGSKTMPP